MKKTYIIVGILALLSLVVGGYLSFLEEEGFKETAASTLEKLEEPVSKDKLLNATESEKGRFVHTGSPYKFGEVIYAQGIGVQVTKGEVVVNPFNLDGESNQKYLSFNVRFLNYNDYEYVANPTDIVFEHIREDGMTQRQDMVVSGYDYWKFYKGSFQFGKIKKNTVREGKIYTPVTDSALKEGKLLIYNNNIPIHFKY